MDELTKLDHEYFALFGDSVDLWNLLQAGSHEDVCARVKRAIGEKKPINYAEEYGYDPEQDLNAGVLY